MRTSGTSSTRHREDDGRAAPRRDGVRRARSRRDSLLVVPGAPDDPHALRLRGAAVAGAGYRGAWDVALSRAIAGGGTFTLRVVR